MSKENFFFSVNRDNRDKAVWYFYIESYSNCIAVVFVDGFVFITLAKCLNASGLKSNINLQNYPFIKQRSGEADVMCEKCRTDFSVGCPTSDIVKKFIITILLIRNKEYFCI